MNRLKKDLFVHLGLSLDLNAVSGVDVGTLRKIIEISRSDDNKWVKNWPVIMSDSPDPGLFRQSVLAKRTRSLAWAEAFVILGLLVWASIEYESNQYLQTWIGNSIGPLGFLLNGTLAGVYGGAMLGYTIAIFTSKRSEEERILESLTRKKRLTG